MGDPVKSPNRIRDFRCPMNFFDPRIHYPDLLCRAIARYGIQRTSRACYVNAPLAVGLVALDRDAGELSHQRHAAQGRATPCCCSTAPRASGARVWSARPKPAGARRAGADAAAALATRPPLHVRAAQARPARLHGAEGGGDGRIAAAAGDDPAYQVDRVNITACGRTRSRRRSNAASCRCPKSASRRRSRG